MSNNVWVTCEIFKGEHLSTRVYLDNGAIVDDLRKQFVRDRLLEIDAARVEVFKVESGVKDKLRAGASLSPYFVTAKEGGREIYRDTAKTVLLF